MEINFDAETDKGTITFKGSLTKDEIDFLLRYAILSLLARGALPMLSNQMDESEEEIVGDNHTETIN